MSKIKEYLDNAIMKGIGSFDLDDTLDLISKYPELDPDGKFVLKLLKEGFEKNRSWIEHDSHGIILKKLRQIILAKAQTIDPAMLRISDVYTHTDNSIGIYINRLGGVRIEDDFLVTKKGSKMLTNAPKLLKSMILKV